MNKNLTEQEARQKVLQKCRDDFFYFGKLLDPASFYTESPDFHQEIVESLMDRSIIQLMFQAPRGFGKSTLLTLFVLHHLFFDKGNKVILLQSKTRPLAIDRLSTIKALLSSYVVSGLFGVNIREETSETWREDKVKFEFKNIITGEKQGVMIRAIGTGMPARGMLVNQTRITLYLLDDPDDEDNCKTKEAMADNLSKFLGNKEGLDSRTGRTVVIGTPIREGCIVDKLNSNFGWVTKVFDAVDESNKLSIWESYRSYEWIMGKKKEYEQLGMLWKWYAELRCQITGEEDRLLKGWKYWSGEIQAEDSGCYLLIKRRNKTDLPEIEKVAVNIFLGIDPASSTKQTADFSVTFAVAYDSDKNIYCLPYFRKRTTPTAHAEQIIQTIRAWKPTKAQVETVGYQEMMRQYLRMRLQEENLYVSGLETKFNPRAEKSARLDTLQPFFATGKIWLMEDQVELEDELNIYPRGKHDDLLDGLYYATRKLIVPAHAVQESQVILFKRKVKELGWQAV